jgi:hypothetical protein
MTPFKFNQGVEIQDSGSRDRERASHYYWLFWIGENSQSISEALRSAGTNSTIIGF